MRDKITSIAEAMATVQGGNTVCTSGFRRNRRTGCLAGLEERFLKTGEPHDLTLVFAAGQGDGKNRGLFAEKTITQGTWYDHSQRTHSES